MKQLGKSRQTSIANQSWQEECDTYEYVMGKIIHFDGEYGSISGEYCDFDEE